MTPSKKIFKKRKFRGNLFRNRELQSLNNEGNVIRPTSWNVGSNEVGPRPIFISTSTPSSTKTVTVTSSSKNKLSYLSEVEPYVSIDNLNNNGSTNLLYGRCKVSAYFAGIVCKM